MRLIIMVVLDGWRVCVDPLVVAVVDCCALEANPFRKDILLAVSIIIS